MNYVGFNLLVDRVEARYNAFQIMKSWEIPAFFLSHNSKDKDKCRELARLFDQIGVYYYFDEQDLELQKAAAQKKYALATRKIEEGIKKCTHMICIYSPDTINSKWVPFEVGYGRSSMNRKNGVYSSEIVKDKLITLTLKGVKNEDIFEFLYASRIIRNFKELHDYLQKIAGVKSLIEEPKVTNRGEETISLSSDMPSYLNSVLDKY